MTYNVPCDMSPPISVTRPEMSGKYGDHPMSVNGTTRISPDCKYEKQL